MELIDKVLTSKYGSIFTSESEAKIELQYKKYCKLLHPDVNNDPRATDAFARLGQLKELAVQALQSGHWEEDNIVYFQRPGTLNTLKIEYLYHQTTDVCEYYVTKGHVVYVFDIKRKKYYDNFVKWAKNFKFKTDPMKEHFLPLLPMRYIDTFETKDKYIVSCAKEEDVYPLRAVIDNFWKGNIPGEHWTWITSRIMEMINFLNYHDIVLNGLDLDSLFICPKLHTLCLLGGWWFATKTDEPLIGTTSKIWANMPPKAKANRIGDPLTDIESMKALGREFGTNCPQAIREYFESGSGQAFSEWQKWEQAMTKGYGKRKFVELNATDKEIYKKE